MVVSSQTDLISSDATDENPSKTSPAVDAIIQVTIAEDELMAYINIEPAQNGGAVPTLDSLKSALAASNVSYNIDMERLTSLAAEPVYHQDLVVARGTAPVNGVNGTATFKINTQKNNIKLTENRDGTVNFYDLGIVENVKRGQVLCLITPPTEGTPGISVTGQPLLPKPGKPVPSYSGKNTELSEDGTAILSKIDGPVNFDGRRIHVDNMFRIEGNIDASTGNIKVASSLTVFGMVMPCFKLEAGENVYIEGTVESASITAGGNVKLKSGITGSELHCDGDLVCRFIQNCKIFVKGNITAEYILNSEVSCGKSLKTMGSLSRIVGGSCVVGRNVETASIGSISGTKTRVELGTDCSVIDQQTELHKKIPQLEKKIESLRPLLSILHQLESSNRLTPEKKDVLDNAQYSYDTCTESLEQAKAELEEIEQTIQLKGFGKIFCRGSVYPGTTIVIGHEILSVSEIMKKKQFYYKDGICTGPAF